MSRRRLLPQPADFVVDDPFQRRCGNDVSPLMATLPRGRNDGGATSVGHVVLSRLPYARRPSRNTPAEVSNGTSYTLADILAPPFGCVPVHDGSLKLRKSDSGAVGVDIDQNYTACADENYDANDDQTTTIL